MGEGTHGVVYQAATGSGQMVAVKRMKPMPGGVSITAYREISLVRRLDHPNIVRLLEVLVSVEPADDDQSQHPLPHRTLNLIFEHCGGGDLAQRIRAHRKAETVMELKAACALCRQLLSALAHLHGLRVIHRDVKPANLLLSEDRRGLKLADFGLARVLDRPLRPLYLDGPVVTLWYRAPELLLGTRDQSAALDCWAAGCILCEMLTCNPLFPGKEARGEGPQEEQLRLIFGVLGVPSEEQWPALASYPYWCAEGPWPEPSSQDTLARHLTQARTMDVDAHVAEVTTVASGLLALCPDHRLTAEAALACRIFDEDL